MDEYVEKFVADTRRKVGIRRRLRKEDYLAYDDVISHPYHMADSTDDALLILDCIEDTFRRRWMLYGKQEDANLAGHAAMVSSAFRSAETLVTSDEPVNPHDLLKGKLRR